MTTCEECGYEGDKMEDPDAWWFPVINGHQYTLCQKCDPPGNISIKEVKKMSEKLVKKLQKENAGLMQDNADLQSENIPIKEFHERIKELEKIINYNSNLFEGKITALEKASEKTKGVHQNIGSLREVHAPYVSYKILKVDSGKYPKIETTIKLAGSIEEFNMMDVEVRLNDLKEKMLEHLDITLDKSEQIGP